MKIAQAYGGTRRRIPVSEGGRETWLSKLVGHEAAEKIGGIYGHEQVDIPRADFLRAPQKKDLILTASGNVPEIARMCNTTERHVRRVRALMREAVAPPAPRKREGDR